MEIVAIGESNAPSHSGTVFLGQRIRTAIGDAANTLIDHPGAHRHVAVSVQRHTLADLCTGILLAERQAGGGGDSQIGRLASPADLALHKRINALAPLALTADQVVDGIETILDLGLGDPGIAQVVCNHIQRVKAGVVRHTGIERSMGIGVPGRDGQRKRTLRRRVRRCAACRAAGFSDKRVEIAGAHFNVLRRQLHVVAYRCLGIGGGDTNGQRKRTNSVAGIAPLCPLNLRLGG